MSNKKRRNKPAASALKNGANPASDGKTLLKIGTIVAILLFAIAGFGAFANWRGAAVREANSSSAALVLPAPQYSANAPAKEYVYAGSKLLAVSEPVAPAPADLAVWRPSNGNWYVMSGQTTAYAQAGWGVQGDVPVPGDYDGDGKTDFSIFRPTESKWYIVHSSTGAYSIYEFGISNDLPAQADYDGDGRTDAAIYRSSNNTWYIQGSTNGFTFRQWGATGDIPASADHDGDGKADIAVWRSSTSMFYSINSSDDVQQYIPINQSGDKPASGDYDGDGRADYAVYNSTTAYWHIRQSTTGAVASIRPQWYAAGDTPVQNDYDGDGKVDIAAWRESTGVWYIRQSSLLNQPTETRISGWGNPGDIPVPAFYRR